MILADEGLNGDFVLQLRANNFDVEWILELNPGISDEAVIKFAKKDKRILITEDKDFGEWVFAHKIRGLSIIFLRYEKQDFEQISKFLNQIVGEYVNKKEDKNYHFITINKNKVRSRKL